MVRIVVILDVGDPLPSWVQSPPMHHLEEIAFSQKSLAPVHVPQNHAIQMIRFRLWLVCLSLPGQLRNFSFSFIEIEEERAPESFPIGLASLVEHLEDVEDGDLVLFEPGKVVILRRWMETSMSRLK